MAPQLVPSSSPFRCLHPPGSSISRTQGIIHAGPSAFSGRSVSGKLPHGFSVSATSASFPSSPSYSEKDGLSSKSANEAGYGDGFASELDHGGDNGCGSSSGQGDDGGNNGGGDHNDKSGQGGNSYGGSASTGDLFGVFLKGWKDRVHADPQFPFKVLMEELVGVGACVLGDMASRPNFGLNELDFVFSTIVVGSILNFSLMYMLAPTSAVASAASTMPAIFASCPPGHMFEHGAYSALDRLGTFIYKGAVFATVGFGAGLLGTAISNVLIGMRKKMDPSDEMQVKAPPTVLNAVTWAIHMGFSSNLRYQAVNGLEFTMASAFPPSLFKLSVIFTRAVNNVLGGMSFVVLARLTGSQKAEEAKAPATLETKESEVSMFHIDKPKDTFSHIEHADKAETEVDATKEESLGFSHIDDANKAATEVDASKEKSLTFLKEDDSAQ